MKVYDLLETSEGSCTQPRIAGRRVKSRNGGTTWTSTAELPNATTVRALLEGEDDPSMPGYPSNDRDCGPYSEARTRGELDSRRRIVDMSEAFSAWRNPPRNAFRGCYSGSSSVYLPRITATLEQIPLPIYQSKRDECRRSVLSGNGPGRPVCGWMGSRRGAGGYIWRSTDDGAHWDTTNPDMRRSMRATKVYDLILADQGA